MNVQRLTKIGIVVTASIIIFIWGLNFLKGKNFFRKETMLFALYNQVDGLSISSPVTINGFQVGQVRDIQVSENNTSNIVVKMAIEGKYNIHRDCMAMIYSADIMGTKAIKLILGTTNLVHESGDTLLVGVEGDLKDQVSAQMLPLKYKAENLMLSVDSVITVIRYIFNKNTQINLAKSFESIKTTIATLEHSSFLFDTLLQTERSKFSLILNNVSNITNSLKDITLLIKNNGDTFTKTINNMNAFSDTLANVNISKTLNETNEVLARFNSIVTKIDKGQGSLGMLVNDKVLYQQMSDASVNLNLLLKDIEKNPKKYVRFSAVDMGKTVITNEKDTVK